jgi:hypothetical protein
MKQIIVFIISLCFISCNSEVKPPVKVSGIPEDAVWFGGVDGGQWILCEKIDTTMFRYRCKIYNEKTGRLITFGEFVLRKSNWDELLNESKYSILNEEIDTLNFAAYDGIKIYLDSTIVLLPDGWIDYPFDSISGIKQLYKLGQENSEKIQY